MANQASHDLKYLVKYMRSRSEIQRLQAEKSMAKEFEEAEEQRRMAFLRAQGETNDKHQAATEISLLYRTKKARRVVREKRLQLGLEACMEIQQKVETVLIPSQTKFRMLSTRKWLARNLNGKTFHLDGKRREGEAKRKVGQDMSVDKKTSTLLKSRTIYENTQRRLMQRTNLFERAQTSAAKLFCEIDTNIHYWHTIDNSMPEEIEHETEHHHLVMQEHEDESQRIVPLKTSLPEDDYKMLEKQLEGIYKKVETAEHRLDNFKNIRWWIAQHLRANYRRRAGAKERLKDTLKRVEWVNTESFVVQRIEYQVKERIKLLAPLLNTSAPIKWLTKYCEHIQIHLATLDSQQESLLLEECNRIDRDAHLTIEFDNLMEELIQVW